jgi:hypothetical protein
VVAEDFKDSKTRAFCIGVIDALHTAMLGSFDPEALGLSATGSYETWVRAKGRVKDLLG